MIDLARKALCNAGLLDRDRHLEITVAVGRSINVQVFPDGTTDFYNVKVSKTSLEREYQALRAVERALPLNVPHVVMLTRLDDMDALITKGVSYSCIRGLTPSLATFVQRYQCVQSASPVFALPTSVTHRDCLRDMIASSAPEGFERYATGWLTSAASEFLDSLPAVRQHGDLMPMNLGVIRDDYVIFDWEDFGRVVLPGFDFCMFLLDAAGFNSKGLERVLYPRDPQIAALRQYLIRTLKLKEQDFPPFVFASLMMYLYLKRSMRYRSSLIEATKQLITALLLHWEASGTHS
jgi:hypothetical protein